MDPLVILNEPLARICLSAESAEEMNSEFHPTEIGVPRFPGIVAVQQWRFVAVGLRNREKR